MSILIEDELLIGRRAAGAGRLAEDHELSRTHARIALAPDGTYTIEDLGSTNGTFVNGARLRVPRILLVEDRIEFGGTTVIVRELTPSSDRQGLEEVDPLVPPRDHPSSDDGPEMDASAAVLPSSGSSHPGLRLPLEIRLEVDFAGKAVRLILDGTTAPIHLRFENGEWRVVTASGSSES